MYTSLLLVALMGPDAAPRAVSESPSWQETYSAARQAGRAQDKPLAVFIGEGKDGWENLSRESKLSTAARKTLAENYVCVYLDKRTTVGRKMSDAFAMNGSSGLVLSTRDGEEQAFRHEGQMSNEELDRTLRRFANGTVSNRTETLARVSYSFTPTTSGTAAQAAPVVYPSAPISYPGGFGGFGGFGGGRGGC